MKPNIIIILLTAAVTLLLVNLMEGRIPPVAQAATERGPWTMGCPSDGSCYVINRRGDVYSLSIFKGASDSVSLGNVKSFDRIAKSTGTLKMKSK